MIPWFSQHFKHLTTGPSFFRASTHSKKRNCLQFTADSHFTLNVDDDCRHTPQAEEDSLKVAWGRKESNPAFPHMQQQEGTFSANNSHGWCVYILLKHHLYPRLPPLPLMWKDWVGRFQASQHHLSSTWLVHPCHQSCSLQDHVLYPQRSPGSVSTWSTWQQGLPSPVLERKTGCFLMAIFTSRTIFMSQTPPIASRSILPMSSLLGATAVSFICRP